MNIQIHGRRTVAVITLSILALGMLVRTNAKPGNKTKIDKLAEVKLSVSGPAKIKVDATGTVPTGGWTDPQLVPSSTSSEKASDSDVVTLHFDFVATKPTGAATQQITPISADATCPAPGAGKTLKVIVHSETNEKSDSIKSPLEGAGH